MFEISIWVKTWGFFFFKECVLVNEEVNFFKLQAKNAQKKSYLSVSKSILKNKSDVKKKMNY